MSDTSTMIPADKDEATVVNGPPLMPPPDAAPATPDVRGVHAPAVEEKDPRYIAVTCTPEFLAGLRKHCPEGKPLSSYIRELVAEKLGIVLLTPSRGSTVTAGMTPEEKKAAITAARKDKQALVKQLLKEHADKIAAQNVAAAAKAVADAAAQAAAEAAEKAAN